MENVVFISDFAESRGLNRDTVNAFIRNHHEIQRDTFRVGKQLAIPITSPGYKLLEEQYPVPSPVVVVNGVPFEEHQETLEELAAIQKKVIQLQEELRQQTYLVAQAEAKNLLLEAKEVQLAALGEEVQELKAELKEERAAVAAANQKVENLRNRGLWERIRNKEV